MERAFQWKELPAAGGLEWLSATPISKDAAFAEIRLGFDANTLAALELSDAFGQKTVVRFGPLDRNPALSGDLFRFAPPQGRVGDRGQVTGVSAACGPSRATPRSSGPGNR